ncbi:MAG: hypothetical protein R2720_04435 [Candidatus Nanopelagicales bacterium]
MNRTTALATAPTPAADDARWADIDAEIDRLCTQAALSADTQGRYKAKWADWVEFCRARGHDDPYTAPYSLFEALIGAVSERRVWPGRQGRPCSPGKLAANLSAIAHGCDVAGVVPAYRHTAHEGDWRDLLDGYRRRFSQRYGPSRQRRPMSGHDAYDILTVEPAGFSAAAGVALTVLLSLLAERPASEMVRVRVGDVSPWADGDGVTVDLGPGDSLRLPCNHPTGGGLFAAGYGWGCPACTLARAANEHSPDTTLREMGGSFHDFANRMVSGLVALKRTVENLRTLFTFTEESTPIQRAGTVLVLCHAAAPLGLRLPYAQARLVGCWAVGRSALSDADTVSGGDVTVRPDGTVEWRLPGFEEPVVLPPTVAHDTPGFGVPEALSQWAAIRSAGGATPADPFFGTINPSGRLPKTSQAAQCTVADWVRQVAKLADIGHDVTPGSTEVGFIREAHKRGVDDYDVAGATNRTSLEHVARHTADIRKVTAIRKLLAARTEKGPE